MEIQAQVREVLKRFNDLIATKNMQVLAEFAPDDNVLLVGSEPGEIVAGQHEIEAFFTRIFARDAAFSWEWDYMRISHSGDLAWFFADGWVILSTEENERRGPYRISGVLQRYDGRWLWRQYHGSEPMPNE